MDVYYTGKKGQHYKQKPHTCRLEPSKIVPLKKSFMNIQEYNQVIVQPRTQGPSQCG